MEEKEISFFASNNEQKVILQRRLLLERGVQLHSVRWEGESGLSHKDLSGPHFLREAVEWSPEGRFPSAFREGAILH